jgi:hypothetical protein
MKSCDGLISVRPEKGTNFAHRRNLVETNSGKFHVLFNLIIEKRKTQIKGAHGPTCTIAVSLMHMHAQNVAAAHRNKAVDDL